MANEKQRGWSHAALIAMVFAFNTVEAHVNFVSERVDPETWENERNKFRRWKDKLKYLMSHLDLPWTPDKRPVKTILELVDLRNAIVHAKTERWSNEIIHPMGTEAPHSNSTLRSRYASIDKLNTAVQDVVERLVNLVENLC
jgi:hypothetical protein